MNYFSQIKRIPTLEPDCAIVNKQSLVESHLRLVASVVRKQYSSNHPLFDDLIQVGNMALMRSAETFDPKVGRSFASYAIPWIKLAIMNYVLDNNNIVRTLTSKPIRLAFFNRTHYTDINGKLDCDRMSQELNISIKDIREMENRCTSNKYTYLDADCHEMYQIKDEEACPVSHLMRSEFDRFIEVDVKQAISELDERDRYILESRYLADKPTTFKDLSAKYGVSIERISQLEKRACASLRRKLNEKFEQSAIV